MKFSTIASFCLAATGVPHLARGVEFGELISLVDHLREEAILLSVETYDKDAEIACLKEQLEKLSTSSGLLISICGSSDSSDPLSENGNSGNSGDSSDNNDPLSDNSNNNANSDNSNNENSDPSNDTSNNSDAANSSNASDENAQNGTINDDSDRGDEEKTSDKMDENDSSDTGVNGEGGNSDDGSIASSTGGEGSDFIFKVGQSWNYNLQTPVDTDVNVDVVFIDMDDSQSTIDELHGKGKGVVCYISIGTVEDWRSDAKDIPDSAIGGKVEGWEGERWVDTNDPDVRAVMTARVKKAASMDCDAIEPDNMMVYSEPGTDVSVSEEEQLEYNAWFADLVHANKMSVGLKNAVDLVPQLEKYFDFALNEECHEWDECEVYADTFIANGKPVFNVEYSLSLDDVCDLSNSIKMDTIKKDFDLDASFCSCVDEARDIDCSSVR